MIKISNHTLKKEGLDRLKMHNLAKSVGLIDHPESQWKWALRQMRNPNPEGIVGNSLMRSGKDLSDVKKKIGLFPNNIRQKIKAMHRENGGRFEVGYSGDYAVGDSGSVTFDKITDSSIHSHPGVKKYINKRANNRFNKYLSLFKAEESYDDGKFYDIAGATKEYERLLDKTLIASPSGAQYFYLPTKERNSLLKTLDKNHGLFNSLKNKKTLMNNDLYDELGDDVVSKRRIDSSQKYIEMPETNMSFVKDNINNRNVISNYLEKSKDVKDEMLTVHKNNESIIKRLNYGKFDPYDYDLIKGPKVGGDTASNYWTYQAGFKSPHNIMSPHTTGVHTAPIRENLPRRTRSVYFRGGLYD